MTSDGPEASMVAVFDIGKTNIKLSVVSGTGEVVETLSRPNVVHEGPPWRHPDLQGAEAWLLASLAVLAARHRIGAIVTSAHGSAAVLVDDDGPVIPSLDYDQDMPAEIDIAYHALGLSPRDRGGAIKPGAAHIGRQLFGIQRQFPERVARARHFLGLPQYWAWRLSGVAASEMTYLSAQSHLWNVPDRRFSDLVARQGWQRLIPPIRPAWQPLGPLKPEIARATGLPADTPVLCGMHDSSANFYRYQAGGMSGMAVVSTGSWIVCLTDRFDPALMDNNPAISFFGDVDGQPIGGVLVMGGREFQILSPGLSELPVENAVEIAGALITRGTMALPSFVRFDGIFPGSGGKGRITGAPPSSDAERQVLATLYVALLADASLDTLGEQDLVVVDGPFAANALFTGLLAALRPGNRIRYSLESYGTASGAALLVGHGSRSGPVPVDLADSVPLDLPGLDTYRAGWRAAALYNPTSELKEKAEQ